MPDLEAMTPAERKVALGYTRNFARILRSDARRIEFGYDLDPQRWPWLALSPLHPVVLDKIQYFSAVTASLSSDSMKPGTRSALTKMGWSCRPRREGTRHAAGGVLEPWSGEHRSGYKLALFDEEGHENAVIWGEGFAFADRDFEGWRDRAKRDVAARAEGSARPATADPVAAGLGRDGRCFVSAPTAGRVIACVGTANGFHPAHPFHTGTGDHVNAAHLFDCALQAAHLMWEPAGTALSCTGGEADFLRFVELDVPFGIELRSRERTGAGRVRLHFAVRQAERENARIGLELEPAPA